MKQLTGVWTALITPFLDDGQIDWTAFNKLIHRQRDAGVTGIVISGTTGESPTLNVNEKLALVKRCRAEVGDKLTIMVGAGSNNTQQSVELAKLSADAGADALLVVTPYYNKPSFNGLAAHYQAIKDAVKIPLCLYHVPSRTGHKIPVKELSCLVNDLGIEMVKEASGDITYFSELRILTKAILLSGDDLIFLPSLSIGSEGVISVITNFFAKEFVKIYSDFRRGNHQSALAINKILFAAMQHAFIESNPGPIKAVMSVHHLCRNNLRLPLAPVSAENYENIISVFAHAESQLRNLGSV